jgi:hypothetical protein
MRRTHYNVAPLLVDTIREWFAQHSMHNARPVVPQVPSSRS